MKASIAIQRICATACGLVCLAMMPNVAGAAGEPDLSGNWTIDESRSDEPHEMLDKAMRQRSGGLGRVRAGVSIFGIPVEDMVDMASDGSGSSRSEPEPPREDLHRHVTDAIDALDIEQDGSLLLVDYDGLHTYRYRFGATMSDGEATIRPYWRGGTFVVERETPGRAKVIEEFRLDRGDRLTWTVSTELESGKNVRIERVYDRAASR